MDLGFDLHAMEAAFARQDEADPCTDQPEWQSLRARLAAGWSARRAFGDCTQPLNVNAPAVRAGSFNRLSAKHLASCALHLGNDDLSAVNLTVSGNGKPVDGIGRYVADQSITGDRG